MLCILIVGFGETIEGVTFDLIDRDLFGGKAGGRLELFVISVMFGVIDIETLRKEKYFMNYDCT